MSKLKSIWNSWKRPVKYGASDPENFSELWSFTSNRLRIVSLLILVFLVVLYGALYFFSPWFVAYQGSKGIKRERLEEQAQEIEKLRSAIEQNERYTNSLRLILLGEVPVDVALDSINNYSNEMIDSLFQLDDSASVKLEGKVRKDMRTKTGDKQFALFKAPVSGVLSQSFDRSNHNGLDIVTEPNANIVASLSGTVIYAGYTRKDGYILVLDHNDGFITVYKHCKTVFKKTGDRVQIGDPIGIVGNSGENSSGPHLHFEVWQDQYPIDPSKLILFKQ